MMGPNGILLRFGEVFLKRGRKRHFLDVLDRQIRRSLASFPELKVKRPYGRFLVLPKETDEAGTPLPIEELGRVVRALSRVFGLESISPCHILPPGREALESSLGDIADAWLEEFPADTFAIRTRRVDKRFPMSSTELNAAMGGVVLERHPDLTVDLGNPDLLVGIEVREDNIFVYRNATPGPGGLPVGSNGKLMALLSGGIDSPVSTWSILKRGTMVESVYFHSFPYTSDAAKEKVKELARLVGQWQGGMRLHVVPFTEIQKACRDAAKANQLVLLYRRFMVRIAERLATKIGAAGLVTGESLGQVASQTLPNMDCIQRVVELPIYRPLIAFDKKDTIRLAKEIGTYDVSIQPFDDCCSLFVPKHPELKGKPEQLERAEQRLEMDRLIDEALAATEVFEV